MTGWRFMPSCVPHSETLATKNWNSRGFPTHIVQFSNSKRLKSPCFSRLAHPILPSPPCCRPGCRRWTRIRRRVSGSSPCAPNTCVPGPWWRTGHRSPAATAWCGGSPAGTSCSRNPADRWTSWPRCPRDGDGDKKTGPRLCGTKTLGKTQGGAWGVAVSAKAWVTFAVANSRLETKQSRQRAIIIPDCGRSGGWS